MIERLQEALAPAGLALTPGELLDVLWLADRIPAGGLGHPAPPAPADPPGTDAPARGAALPGGAPPPGAAPHPADLYAPTAGGAPGSSARAVRVPAGRALPDALPFGRALRPLKRTAPSRHAQRLDEGATAELIAETGVLDLVLRPRPERWLSAALVVDDGLSMELWQDTAAALREVLETVGVFRTVRCYGLDSRAEDGPVLRARPFSRSAAPVSPGSVCPADGRGAVLVVSDAIGAGWHRGRIAPLLARWGGRCPTAVVQPLPQRLWAGSALAPERLLLRARRPGAANAALDAADPVLPEVTPPGMPVPVLDLQPAAVAAWASLVTAGRPAVLPSITLGPATAPDAGPGPSATAAPAPAPAHLAGRLAHFRRAASPEAFRLAGHLAATRPLTLGLMRLVQRAVHGRVDPAVLAEVLLGGLLRRTPGPVGRGPAAYEFRPGLRELLLETVPVADLLAVTDLVTEALRAPRSSGPTLPALRADLTGPDALAPGATAFAASSEPLLRHFATSAERPAAGGTAPGSFEVLTLQDAELAALVAAEDWRGAVERGEEVLEQLIARHGPDDLRVLAGRLDLAEWIGRAGSPQTARALARELHTRLARLLGPYDGRTLAALTAAGDWAGRAGHTLEAVDAHREVLAAREADLGPLDPRCVETLALLAYWTGEQGKPQDALTGYGELLRRQEQVYGAEDLRALNTRANLASWTGQAGRSEAALQLWHDLLADVGRHAPPEHPLRLIAATELVHWRAECGDPADTLDTLGRLLPRLTEALGPLHSYPYGVRWRLAHWTGELGDPEGAREQMRALLAELGTVFTPEHRIFLSCRVEFAEWTARTGDPVTALRLLTELVPEIEAVLGPAHPQVVRARELEAALRDAGE
ncbi:SAV_2336 N-terminal domain-related protein [Kitasatospora sp. NPDC054939]